MKDCIFCRIIGGEIPSHTVYSDPHTLAFLDIEPHAKGHTLIIPKVHAETVLDLNEELLKTLLPAVKRVMEILDNTLAPDGFNVGWNHYEAGGQVVPHLHIHVAPRWHDDGGGSFHSIVNEPGNLTVKEVAALIDERSAV